MGKDKGIKKIGAVSKSAATILRLIEICCGVFVALNRNFEGCWKGAGHLNFFKIVICFLNSENYFCSWNFLQTVL
jgi:hypothetical protein